MRYKIINIPLFLYSSINESFEAISLKNLTMFNLEKVRSII